MKIDYNAYRTVLESQYGDRATVFETRQVADPIMHAAKRERVEIYKDVPCHLDWSAENLNDSSTVAQGVQTVTVLMPPDKVIKAGAEMEIITAAGRKACFKAAAPPAVVPSHQRIILRYEAFA